MPAVQFTLAELQWHLWKNWTGNFVAVAVTAEAKGMWSQVLMGTSPISDWKIVVKCVSPLFFLPGAILASRMTWLVAIWEIISLRALPYEFTLPLCCGVNHLVEWEGWSRKQNTKEQLLNIPVYLTWFHGKRHYFTYDCWDHISKIL